MKQSADFHDIRIPKVGEEVSDFSLRDLNGHVFTLSSFRGNYVFLNFWATWCPPCVEEFPYMEALNQRLKAKRFTMIAVSVDKTVAEVKSFESSLDRRPSFLVLMDPEHRLAEKLGTNKFPETYVIDPAGRLVEKYIGPMNWLSPTVLAEWDGFLRKTE